MKNKVISVMLLMLLVAACGSVPKKTYPNNPSPIGQGHKAP